MTARHQQIIATLTLALAFSAVLIGSAQAADRPDNRAGIRGIGSQNAEMSDVFTRAVARAPAVPAVRPVERAGLRRADTTPSTPTALSDVFERAILSARRSTPPRRDHRRIQPQVVDNAPVVTTASTGLRWTGAGSARATLALLLVFAGLAIAARTTTAVARSSTDSSRRGCDRPIS